MLVAIAIPVFTSQLEKSREATDAANIRSAYAEVMVAAVEDTSTTTTKTVDLAQKTTGWQNSDLQDELEKLFDVDGYTCDISGVGANLTATIGWAAPTTSTDGHATIAIGSASSSSSESGNSDGE